MELLRHSDTGSLGC
ncbi:hypothetical protein HU200_022352 [Digitaria exilis]|uniref:Uncharacterized protein n=1 Tax=Digitaria exilis TaxID=1010633 RepID=A0A835CD12_9POAL|nr:hypothetical protein HU200_049585 [Digitaria exilis]KAF8722525.1 hypothetical protein HU200_022352 [Digitaria exilis]